jgi:hypothetical protein
MMGKVRDFDCLLDEIFKLADCFWFQFWLASVFAFQRRRNEV